MKRRARLAADALQGAREEQQDSYVAGVALLADGRTARLVIVADGMGGHAGGATASTIAVERFLAIAESGQWADYPELLRQALLAANRAIGDRIGQAPQLSGMGCTIVAAIFDERDLWAISVGDSLLLHLGERGLERLNADHSMAGLAEPGADVPAETQHLLRSALTGRPIPLIDERRFTIEAGTYLLATDGLLTLDGAAIAALLERTAGASPEAQARALLDAVTAAADPEQDNCTVLVFHPAAAPRAGFDRRRVAAGGALLAIGIAVTVFAWRESAAPPVSTAAASRSAAPVQSSAAADASARREGAALPRLPAAYPVTPPVKPSASATKRPAAPPSPASPAPVPSRGAASPPRVEADLRGTIDTDVTAGSPKAAPAAALPATPAPRPSPAPGAHPQ